jgi:hypothetical protein
MLHDISGIVYADRKPSPEESGAIASIFWAINKGILGERASAAEAVLARSKLALSAISPPDLREAP